MLADLKDKAVLITGSSTGIGAAVAIGFGAVGARITVHGNTNVEAAKSVARKVRAAGGIASVSIGDLTAHGTVERVVQEHIANHGQLDILINNAGSLVERVAVGDVTDELCSRVIDVNLRQVVNMCCVALPFIRETTGTIINTGSIAANNGGGIGIALYAGTKGFVASWTRSLALELAREGIRVNCVSPGVVDTAIHSQTPPEVLERVRQTIPFNRFGNAEECVGAYLFLASAAMSSYVTGQTIEVNGGQHFS